MATEAAMLASRRQRAEKLAEQGVALFPARIPRPLDRQVELAKRFADHDAEALKADRPLVTIAGRIASIRSFGKAAFAVLRADGVTIRRPD